MRYFLILLFAFNSAAKEETLFDLAPEEVKKPSQTTPVPVQKKKKRKTSEAKPPDNEESNLPSYYQNRDLRRVTQHKASQVLPSNVKQVLEKVNIGDTFEAVINHNVIAFNDEPSPVLAVITSGKLAGYRVLGEAKLNDTNEGVTIEFKALSKAGQSYSVAAIGLTPLNQTYFNGKYYSNEAGLFAGTFLSSFVAAYFDGLVPRETNYFGQVQVDNSVDSAFKKGMSGAAIESANVFKEKLKKAKSLCEIRAPIRIKILVNDLITER
jgi:hypothetical protein